MLLFVLFALQRQGRSDTYATEFDLEAEEYVPLPKGDVHKKKDVIQDVTLHDLDIANARPQVGYKMKILLHDVIIGGILVPYIFSARQNEAFKIS